jgi:iron complex transport system permease protein
LRLTIRTRAIVVTIGSLVVLLLVSLVALVAGTSDTDIFRLFTGGLDAATAQRTWMIILSYRLPRIMLAAVAGGALASSGAVFQAVLRNPLADPYVIGVAAGGAVGAVVSIVLLGERGIVGTSLCAFAGSTAALALVYGLSMARRGGSDVSTVILAGVIVASFMNAITLLIISMSPSEEMQRAVFWLMGEVSTAGYGKMTVAALILGATWGWMYLNASRLNLLMFGDSTAAHLGLDVGKFRWLFMASGALITATVVSLCGAIGFVGLVVPHTARLLFGPDSRLLLPVSLFGGAAFLVASDCLARMVVYPVELPVGVITALIGAPFFLYLLVRKPHHGGDVG